MTIYFTYSKKLGLDVANQIKDLLRKFDHEILDRIWPSEQSINSSKEAKEVFNTNMKNLKDADIVLAESSFVSTGVGYEVSLAIEERKPVLVLYNVEEDKSKSQNDWFIPTHMKGNTSKYLILKEYKMRSLEKSIELGLKDAKSMINTKFLLIIPHDIDVYLEWCVKERGMAKAAATREALKLMMKNNEDFKEYLEKN